MKGRSQPMTKSSEMCFANLCKSVFICGSLLVFLCGTATAQGVGKAEPNRIEFRRGTTSTTISDTVRGSEEAEYVLSAKKRQRLTIKITSTPAKSSAFYILGKGNDGLDLDFTLGRDYDSNFNYSGVLPTTGDYLITVKRQAETKGTSHYRMTITIKP